MRSGLLIGLFVIAALGGAAGASPLSEALARHADADVTALRARREDPAARCTLGAIHARRNDLPRASLYLAGCDHAELPDDIAAAVLPILRDVKRRLDAGRYAAIDVMSRPEGLTAELDALPGESFTTPTTIWIDPGHYQLRVSSAERAWTQRVLAEPRRSVVVMIETGLGAKPSVPRRAVLDFTTDDSAGMPGEQHTAPPPDRKHPSLLADRYRGIPEPAAEGAIDDPLAVRRAPAVERALWLGARLGAGMFDDSSAASRAGLAIALAGRYRLTETVFAAGRADWSRRGGEVMTGTVDVIGASAGLGMTVVGRSSPSVSPPASLSSSPSASSSPPAAAATRARSAGLALALIGQLRTDLRLTAMRDAAPVRRAGLGIAAGAELALPATPLTVGLRFEQGVTDLVAGSRDRAVLVELGIDLR